MSEVTARQVGRFYDEVADTTALLLGDAIHLGYWPDGAEHLTFEQAQDGLTRLIGAGLDLGPGDRLLDVGCGTGQPAALLARENGCGVVGITLSERQRATASARAEPGQEYLLADLMEMSFPESSFDAACMIESLLHMPDKLGALREVARLLRPGGRLAIADLFEYEAGSRSPFAMLPPDVGELVRQAGFEGVEVTDITAWTARSTEMFLRRLTERRSSVAEVCPPGLLEMIELAARWLADAMGTQIGYLVLTARRGVPPHEPPLG
jgi:cyclopropane fatty-acyl-phospholipid synthase-like methyltransferase